MRAEELNARVTQLEQSVTKLAPDSQNCFLSETAFGSILKLRTKRYAKLSDDSMI